MSNASSDSPVVSIVVNNYNYGRFLRECIDSALHQTYARTEVIIVDDGSTDDSKEIIASYGKQVLPVFKDNGGQASAFNAGFAASRGDVLIFLDADDLLRPETAEYVMKAWHPGLAKVQYLLEIVDARGERQGASIPAAPMQSGDLRNFILKFGTYISPPTSGNAFSRHVLEEILPVPEAEWRVSADGYLVYLTPFFGDVASIQRVLGCYRIHESNNFTMESLEPRKLRRALRYDVQAREALARFGASRGITVDKDTWLRSPSHLKTRIASLRLDPDEHPFNGDRLHRLALQGIDASLKAPDFSLRKKLLLSIWFVLIALLPRPFVELPIKVGLIPQGRRHLFHRVST